MINAGTYQDMTWPDDWTSTTRDGKRSAQFEHTLLVVEGGCEVLTRNLTEDQRPWFMRQMDATGQLDARAPTQIDARGSKVPNA